MTSTSPATTIHTGVKAVYRQPGRIRLVRQAARAAFAQAALPGGAYEWTVRLSDDDELRRLNRQFRGMDKPTDVLSFGGEGFRDGRQTAVAPGDAPHYLGDIVISMERCAAQAIASRHGVDEELALLVAHGTLHLLGYDHDTKARKGRMWSAQARALRWLGIVIDVP